MRTASPGKVLLMFQPAEEGVPEGERGGAPLMLEEGLSTLHIRKWLGLHLMSFLNTDRRTAPGPVHGGLGFLQDHGRLGKQSHGAALARRGSHRHIGADRQCAADNREPRARHREAAGSRCGRRHQRRRAATTSSRRQSMLGIDPDFQPRDAPTGDRPHGRACSGIASANGASATPSRSCRRSIPCSSTTRRSARASRAHSRRSSATTASAHSTQTVSEDFSRHARRTERILFRRASRQRDRTPRRRRTTIDLFYADEAALEVGLRSLLRASRWTTSESPATGCAQQVDGKAAEPVPALVVLARDRRQRRIRMDHCLGFERCRGAESPAGRPDSMPRNIQARLRLRPSMWASFGSLRSVTMPGASHSADFRSSKFPAGTSKARRRICQAATPAASGPLPPRQGERSPRRTACVGERAVDRRCEV